VGSRSRECNCISLKGGRNLSELIPTSSEEYRKGKTKIIKLKSGNVFEIRKMSVPVFADLYTELGIVLPPGTPLEKIDEIMQEKMSDPEFSIKIINAALKVVPRCIIRPPIVDKPEPGMLTVDDISPEDLFETFETVMEFSGITRLAEAARQRFQKKPAW